MTSEVRRGVSRWARFGSRGKREWRSVSVSLCRKWRQERSSAVTIIPLDGFAEIDRARRDSCGNDFHFAVEMSFEEGKEGFR